MTAIAIKGAKAGQDKPRRPSIAKDSVASTSTAKLLYGLAEGEVWGLVDGGKSIRLDGTPLIDDAGNPNFEGVTWDFRAGTNEQEYIKGFPDVSNETPINVELRSDNPWIKAFTDTQLSAIRVRFKWNRLSKTDPDDGDVTGYKIDYAIDLQTDGGVYQNVLTTKIEDKTSAGYERTHRIDLPRSTTGWQIRVRRLTPNDPSEYIQDDMFIDAVAEVIDVKLAYPNTALLGLQYNAETFSSIAKLEAHVRGAIMRVPSNYDAVARTYTGIWDGTFKDAYSNNPAWAYFHLCTQWRGGLGERLDITMIDKWSLYALGQYCDQMVSDGQGGLEPRFTCNVYLQKQVDAYQVLQNLGGIFRAMSYWNGERIVLDADVPQDPVYTFSRANVIDGNFEYTGTRARDRHTLAKVAWDNPLNRFETEYEYIRDEKAMSKFGVKVLDLSAFGCTSQAQAQRAGLWALKTEQLETRQVSFGVGLDGFIPQVGNIINVSDELFAGRANGGRVSAVSDAQYVVTLDRDVVANIGDVLIVNGGGGQSERRTIKSVSGRKITLNAAFTAAEAENIWAIETADLKLMRFRVMSITQNDNSTFNISAIQHEPQKYDAIDFGTDVKPTEITIVNPDVVDAPASVTIDSRHREVQGQMMTTLVIGWAQVKGAVAYDVEWRKDDGSWVKVPRTGNVSVDIDGVYSGNYLARVRAISPFEVQSQPTSSMLTEVQGKIGLPPTVVGLTATGILFGIDLKWGFASGSGDAAYTEIETGSAPNTNVKLLGQYSYPTNSHTVTGLQGNLAQSYRARLVDKLGFKSPWSTWVTGATDASADKVLDIIQGKITNSSLDTALRTEVAKIEGNGQAVVLAQNAADAAQQAAADAATLAGNKGEVIYQWQTPATARQLPQNLWIDTTGGNNTPKRWDGSAWVVVTDKAATDAAQAASDAQYTADAADAKAVAAQGTADTAKANAKTADDKAVAAQASATAALSSLTDISADNKLTAVEKKQVKLIFDDIQRTDADLLARAAKYSVSSSAYTTAYNALVSYISPKLTDMAATSIIVRTTFNSKFDDLFLKRAELNTAIVNAAKAASDAAAQAASDANDNIAIINQEIEQIVNENGVIAGEVDTLQATVGDHTTSIQHSDLVLDDLSAQSTTVLDVNGYVVGVGTYNDGKTGSFIANVDEFYIGSPDGVKKTFVHYPAPTTLPDGTIVPQGTWLRGDLFATGTISGDKIKANTTITAPNIEGGQIAIGDDGTGNPMFSVDSQGNLLGKSGTFEGNVLADKISGTIDIESMKRSAWTPGYTVYYTKSEAYEYSYEFNKDFPSNKPSRGAIDFYSRGLTSGTPAGSTLFEINLLVKTPTVVKQAAYLVDNGGYININGNRVLTFNSSAWFLYDDPRPEGEPVSSYVGTPHTTAPLQYVLPAGEVNLQIILVNWNGDSTGLILAGDFIDNDNVKYT